MLEDRIEAGERLAPLLEGYRQQRPLVLALPRGGVPVGAAIARKLDAPLDVLVAHKVASYNDPEYGLGAVVEDGTVLLDERRVRSAGYAPGDLGPAIERATLAARTAAARWRGGRAIGDVTDRTVLLTDDGVATGGTVRAALRSLGARAPRAVVVVVGVAPRDTIRKLEREAARVVALERPERFFAVGEFYRRFEPVSDAEVMLALEAARRARAP